MERQPSTLPVRLVIWAALLGTVFVYGVVAFIFGGRESVGSYPSFPTWLLPAAAVVTALTSLMMHRQGSVPAPRQHTALRPMDIPVWAMDEAVAVFGLVAVFMGGSFSVFVAYGVASLILLVVHRPQS